jgi:secondary thiamine-phosphate synthase enzyme
MYSDRFDAALAEMPVRALTPPGAMHAVFAVETARAPQFIDITPVIEEALAATDLYNGIVVITSQHTTASIKINENEPELLKDMERFLCEIAPPNRYYRHNDFTVRTVNVEEDECPNAHAHCQHLLLSASETVPVVEGRLLLGRWQRIFLVELDRPRLRNFVVSFIGSNR